MRKLTSLFILIIIPCVILTISVKSCTAFRDWSIATSSTEIGGCDERYYLKETERIDDPVKRLSAKKEIRKIFNDNFWVWADGGVKEMKALYEKYGLMWSDTW